MPIWRGPRDFFAAIWAGFATRERLSWWKTQGQFVDIPATRYAERHDVTRQLAWDDVPDGLVIRGLLLHPAAGKEPLLKVVTRASTPEEMARFGHGRMPLLESPLFSAEAPPIPPPDPPKRPAQGELFGELFE